MGKTNNELIWTEEGYRIFAHEGLAGIQIERLARILNLNKSGFYHYFGDLDGFSDELIHMHQKKADNYLAELRDIERIDPDCFHLLVKYKVPVMFQMQSIRNKKHEVFYKVAEGIDQTEDVILRQLWSDYLGIQDRPDLAIRYLNIVRDMFYMRITFENFDYPYLHNLFTETKAVIQQISEGNLTLESDEPL